MLGKDVLAHGGLRLAKRRQADDNHLMARTRFADTESGDAPRLHRDLVTQPVAEQGKRHTEVAVIMNGFHDSLQGAEPLKK